MFEQMLIIFKIFQNWLIWFLNCLSFFFSLQVIRDQINQFLKVLNLTNINPNFRNINDILTIKLTQQKKYL